MTTHVGITPRGRAYMVAPTLILAVVSLVVSVYSFRYRQRGFNMLWYGHEWCTASTVIFARNWYREGAWNLRFTQLWNPASAEFASLSSRQPYYSAPPGTVLPIHAIALLAQHEPTVAMVMGYNVAAHGMAALALGLTIFMLVRRAWYPAWSALVCAATGIVLFVLMPGPQYWLQNVFYSDQAIILPFALFIMLEVLHDEHASPTVTLAQGFVLFWGCVTDWFMLFAMAGVYAKRLAWSEIALRWQDWLRASFLFWLPAGMALGLFALQLGWFGLLPQLIDRALMYAGADGASVPGWHTFNGIFWGKHVERFYGGFTIPLFVWSALAAAVFFLIVVAQRLRRTAVSRTFLLATSAMWVATVPVLTYVYCLRNYAAAHEYSTLKLAITLPIVFCGVLPILLRMLWDVCLPRHPVWLWKTLNGAALVLLLAGMTWSARLYLRERRRVAGMYMGPRAGNPFVDVGRFVAGATRMDDLAVSPHFHIPTKPPQWLCYSMKRVYHTPAPFDIYSKMHASGGRIESIAVVVTNMHADLSAFDTLLAHAYHYVSNPPLAVYKIDPRIVQRVVEAQEPARVAHLQRLHAEFGRTNAARVVYLYDLRGLVASNLHTGRYGLFQRGESHIGETLYLWGFDCGKALTAMAPIRGVGRIECRIPPHATRFRTVIGVNNPGASVVFGLALDGSNIFKSPVVTSNTWPMLLEADVRGRQHITLLLEPFDTNAGDEAVWVDPNFLVQP